MRNLKMVFVATLLLCLMSQHGQSQDKAVPPQKPAQADGKQQPLPKEFAAFAYVPSESAVLISLRPTQRNSKTNSFRKFPA